MIYNFSISTLRFAVDEVYSAISLPATEGAHELPEEFLWRELSCCILSSQVRYELARAVASAIEDRGALFATHKAWDLVASDLETVIGGTFVVAGRPCRYRFPTTKSHQIAKTWSAIREQSQTLGEFLFGFDDMMEVREWLVRHAPGLGPKQSSMFLRNAGLTLDLAVLDRHVVRYMEAVELLERGVHHTARLEDYRATESVLRRHADEFGYRVGLLDWAIWIVMRVARSRREIMENPA